MTTGYKIIISNHNLYKEFEIPIEKKEQGKKWTKRR